MPDIKNFQNSTEKKLSNKEFLNKPSVHEKIVNQERQSTIDRVSARNEVLQVVDHVEHSGDTRVIQPIGGMTTDFQKRQKEVENILSHNLEEAYLKMLPIEQQRFKMVGEFSAREINSLLDSAKIKIGKIIDIIKKWLKLIPNVNKFFVEQEAKIKADKIIHLKNNQ